jgi:hypothetical protein
MFSTLIYDVIKAIEFYDTTLHEGTQGEHFNLSVQDTLSNYL